MTDEQKAQLQRLNDMLAASQGREGYGDRVKAIEAEIARINELVG